MIKKLLALCFFFLLSLSSLTALAQTLVTINVTDDTAAALSGISVYAFDGASYTGSSSTTDSSGQATLSLTDSDYRFRADLNGTQYFSAATNHCTTPACTSVDIEIPQAISVTVSGSAGGFESGLNVYAFNGSTYANKSGVTDSNGVAMLQLEQGNYRFRIDKNGTQYFTDATDHCLVPGCTAASVYIPESITVSVTNAGLPAAGLNIYAFDNTSYANKSAVTDSNGQAVFTLLAGDYRFRIDKEGTQYFTGSTNHCSAPGCNAVSFDIPQSVAVSITENSSPAIGLNVYVFDGSTYANKSAVTDSNGDVLFSLLEGDYRFRIDKNGTQYFTDSSNHCSVPGCSAIAFDLPEAVTLSVTEAGAPIAGLNVYAFDGTSYAGKSAITDSNGEAVFTLLSGSYRFRIDKDGTQFFTQPLNHCDVPGCTSASFDIPATVSINVSSSDGSAEVGLNVYAFDGTVYANKSAVTDSAGLAEFTLEAGDYRFRIDKNGTQFFTESLNHCAVPGCTVIDYEIPENIAVTVTSSGGGFESGLNVYAFDGTTYSGISSVTDATGQAIFTLLPGDYRFRIDKNGTQYFTDDTNHCSVPGCSSADFEISESVTVSVTNSAGGVESGLNVYAFDGTGYAGISAVTDGTGLAVFTLLNGDYRFRIDKNGTQFFTDSMNHCSLPGCTEASFEIPENITVTVNSTAGGPEVGLNVYAFNDSTYAGISEVTDSSGLAIFTLPPDDYRFRIDKNGTQYFTSQTNDCSAPGCNVVNFDLPEDIVVTVLSSSGAPQEGLNIYAFDDTTYAGKTRVTNSEGEAVFTLLSGNYRFRVDKDGSQYFSNPSNHCAVPGCVTIGAQVPALLSELVTDYNLGMCLDAAAAANSWAASADVSILDCSNLGISNLAGLENFSNLTSLDLSNNPITLLDSVTDLVNLTALNLSGTTMLECNQLGDIDSFFSIGVVTNPASCLGEGELVFTVANPNQDDTNQFSFDVASTDSGDIVSSAITYNPLTDSFDGRVFLIDGRNGNLLLELENPAPTGSDYFGWSIATLPSGDIIVGAWADEVGVIDAGAVYIFSQINGDLLATIDNPSPESGDRFGYSVASSSNSSVIVGSPNETGGGAVYVFDSTGVLQQTITNPTGDGNAEFGRAVAVLSTGDIIIGSPKQDVVAGSTTVSDAGSIHRYTEFSGTALLQIDNPNPVSNDEFGSEVTAASNDDIVVSARLTDNFANNDGSVSVFNSLDGSLLWSVVNPVADASGLFGAGLATSSQGDIVVGAANYDSADNNTGRVYVFDGAAGDLIKIIENPSSSNNANFGQGFALTPADQIAIGAFGADGGFGELHLFTSIRTGEAFTLINEQDFTSTEERDCVLAAAAENGWASLEEAGDFDFECSTPGGAEPDPFSFIELDDALVNAVATSNVITLTGFSGVLTAEVAIHTHAKNPQLSVNGGAFTNLPQDVEAGDTLQLKFLTPNITEFTSIATVSVGAAENGGFGVYTDWIVNAGDDVLGNLGFQGPFQVFGHPSNDDLFIVRDDSDGQIPGVSPFYLRRDIGGELFYDLVPNITETQALAEGFNLSTPLSVEPIGLDLNGDLIADLLIEGLDEIGGQNVIVYGGKSLNSPPAAYAELDSELKNFYRDLDSIFVSPPYWNHLEFDDPIDDPNALAVGSIFLTYARDDDIIFIPVPQSAGQQLTQIFNSVIFDQIVDGADIQWFDGALNTYDRDYDSFPGAVDYDYAGSPQDFQIIEDVWRALEEGLFGASIYTYLPQDLDFDGIENYKDAFPLDERETSDIDGDGIGDNTDKDDDNDRMPDSFETLHRFDPSDRLDAHIDSDGDGATNFEEFLAGTFPGSGTAEPLDEQFLEVFSPGNNSIMIKSKRRSSQTSSFQVRNVQVAKSSAPLNSNSRTFDSSIGITYEFVSDDLMAGTAKFYIEEEGVLSSEAFLTKSFSGGSVTLDSKNDFNPPIDDVLASVNSKVPLLDVPVVVQFLDADDVVVDELTLSISVVRMMELEFRNGTTGEVQNEFSYNDDVTARFILNGINQAALNVTRFDVEVSYRKDASSVPQDWPLLKLFPAQLTELGDLSEIPIDSKAYELTGQVQQVGEYTFIVKAIVENFQGDQPEESSISTSALTLTITEAAAGETTTVGFGTGYLAFGNGGPFDSIYIAKLDAGNSVVGELEVLLEPRNIAGKPTYAATLNPSQTKAGFDPSDFTNGSQVLQGNIQVGDINADGLTDLVLSDLPNNAMDSILFGGTTNADIVFKEIDTNVTDFFRIMEKSLEFKENRRNFLQDFISGKVSYNGASHVPRMEKGIRYLDIYGPELFTPGTIINERFCNDLKAQYVFQFGIDIDKTRVECYWPELHTSTTDIKLHPITISRYASYDFRFFDQRIRATTPDEEIVTKAVVVEFSDITIEVRDLGKLPNGLLANDLAGIFDLLVDGYYADFIGSNVAETLRQVLTEILGKEVFGGPIPLPQNFPPKDLIPGNVNGDDTQFVLSQIHDIIDAIYRQRDKEVDHAPGTEQNPHPTGTIEVNGSPSVFSSGSTGDITLVCDDPTDLDTEQQSCPLNYKWNFLGTGNEGDFVSGSSIENHFYDAPGTFDAQCRIEVACPSGAEWFVRDTKLEVTERILFGYPNELDLPFAETNISSGEATFYDPVTKFQSMEWPTGSGPDQNVDLSGFLTFESLAHLENLEWRIQEFNENFSSAVTYIQPMFEGGENPEIFDFPIHVLSPGNFDIYRYRISVRQKGDLEYNDHMILTVHDTGTQTRFNSWYDGEIQFLAEENWHAKLPILYDRIDVSPVEDPEFFLVGDGSCPNTDFYNYNASNEVEITDAWDENISSFDLEKGRFHPGATYEIRSNILSSGNHGHQATYDALGNLIELPEDGSGSVDRYAPYFILIPFHAIEDVNPFIWAAQLDGNPIERLGLSEQLNGLEAPLISIGPNLRKYFEVRPATIGDSSYIGPGQCQPALP